MCYRGMFMLLKLYSVIGLVLFFGASVSLPAYAQSQKQAADPLTLPQAKEIAYKNNKNLLIVQEKITQAQGKLDETVSGLYPTLSFDLAYNRASQSFLFGPVPTVSNSESLDKKVSLTQLLYTGNRTAKGINVSQLSWRIPGMTMSPVRLPPTFPLPRPIMTF